MSEDADAQYMSQCWLHKTTCWLNQHVVLQIFCYETDRGAMKPTEIRVTKLLIKVCNARLMGLRQQVK